MRTALCLAVLCSLFIASTAQARAGLTVAEDWAIAEAFWGRQPTQCTSLEWGTPRDGWGGESTIPTPGWSGTCVFHLVPSSTQTKEGMCLIVLHEYGHLLGLGNNQDPASIMYEGPGLYLEAAPVCAEPPKVFQRNADIPNPGT